MSLLFVLWTMLPEVIRLLSPAITDICFQDNFALRNSKREVVCTTAQLGLSLGDVRLQEATRGQSRVTHSALPQTRPVTLFIPILQFSNPDTIS